LEVLAKPEPIRNDASTFRTLRQRYVKKSTSDQDSPNDPKDHSQDGIDEEEKGTLFSCPEEGCVKAYNHFSFLQTHLDIGKHKRLPEQETLYDKARKKYASILKEREKAAFLVLRLKQIKIAIQQRSCQWTGP
jgi:hypothetical protein